MGTFSHLPAYLHKILPWTVFETQKSSFKFKTCDITYMQNTFTSISQLVSYWCLLERLQFGYICIVSYLMEMLQQRAVLYGLRSTGEVNLEVNQGHSRARPAKMGERSFINAAPTLWNKLPTDVKNAENITLLKLHLFKKCYEL